MRDIVPEHVLLDWLDVSRKTLKRWGVPVNSEQGQTRFYHMPTVIDYLAEKTGGREVRAEVGRRIASLVRSPYRGPRTGRRSQTLRRWSQAVSEKKTGEFSRCSCCQSYVA